MPLGPLRTQLCQRVPWCASPRAMRCSPATPPLRSSPLTGRSHRRIARFLIAPGHSLWNGARTRRLVAARPTGSRPLAVCGIDSVVSVDPGLVNRHRYGVSNDHRACRMPCSGFSVTAGNGSSTRRRRPRSRSSSPGRDHLSTAPIAFQPEAAEVGSVNLGPCVSGNPASITSMRALPVVLAGLVRRAEMTCRIAQIAALSTNRGPRLAIAAGRRALCTNAPPYRRLAYWSPSDDDVLRDDWLPDLAVGDFVDAIHSALRQRRRMSASPLARKASRPPVRSDVSRGVLGCRRRLERVTYVDALRLRRAATSTSE